MSWESLILIAARYLLVGVDIVQVFFLCQAQVEEGLPVSLHRISVCLKNTPASVEFSFNKVISHRRRTYCYGWAAGVFPLKETISICLQLVDLLLVR